MARKFAISCLLVICVPLGVLAFENTQNNVANSLTECYNGTEPLYLTGRLPMTMNVLIALIREIEKSPTLMDLRLLSINLLHRFRQDGIQKAIRGANMDKVLPYSPVGHEKDKFKVILRKLIPGDAQLFPNETLSAAERCTLHVMLSESIEEYKRGDEDQVCSKLAKYTLRMPRSVPDMAQDVEIINPESMGKQGKGNLQESFNPNNQVDMIPRAGIPNTNVEQSRCPLENGVVYTTWGAVSAGSLIAGIAAGSEPQDINIRNIVDISRDISINSVWGATLAGDLAEAGYLSFGNNMEIEVGADGGWTSTQVPRNYYLNRNERLYMTDAEIRGGLDGLILGLKMKEYKEVSSMKLSQLLDMYYSQRGVFGQDIKACNRKENYKGFAKNDLMKAQAEAFGNILNYRVAVPVTMGPEIIKDVTAKAADKLDAYIPSSLRDVPCLLDSQFQTVATDIVIILDFSWQFDVIYPTLSYILDNIDVNPYNSNFTILNAYDGSYIINSSNSIIDFHGIFNRSMYDKHSKGFDLTTSVAKLEHLVRNKMEAERRAPEAGGRSLIALFVTHTTSVDGKQKDYITERLNDIISVKLPDLKFIVLTSGATDIFQNIVKDPSRDIFTLSDSNTGTSIVQSASPLLKRTKEIPRRIVNSKCGSDWEENGSDKQLVQYVEPKGINYYSVHPNYFFGDATRNIKIRGTGVGTLTVCHSRDIEQLMARSNRNGYGSNNTQSDSTEVECKQINSDEYSISLTDACSGKSYIKDCRSVYISVAAPQPMTGRFGSCSEKGCRYPDNLKYTITLDNLGCYSSGHTLLTNVFMIGVMLSIVFYKNFVV